MDYRREIDGLRALAVVPVILFHAGFQTFSGGFVGVDVFFVISGYLITTIILFELEQGKFSIINFYERRARRILPALFFVMLACLPFAWFWLLPSDMKVFSKSLVAVSLFSSNILFWRESGYFDTAAELKPLLHTWSLAVEEQYYVLFPVFLMLFWRLGKRWILGLLAAAFVSSLVLAQWASLAKPSAAFFLLPTRGWELLIGAFAAFYFSNRNRKDFSRGLSEVGGWLGVVLIFYAVFTYSKDTPFPGFYALVPTVGTVLIILFATQQTTVGKFVGNKAFVSIGLISYSAYLWHQPLFAFARHRSLFEPSHTVFLTLSFLALLFGYCSWRFVEMPFRRKRKFSRTTVFSTSLIFSLSFILFGFIGYIKDGWEYRVPPYVNEVIKEAKPVTASCPDNKSDCVIGNNDKDIDFVLIGDSHAGRYAYAFEKLTNEFGFSFKYIAAPWCAPLINWSYLDKAPNPACFKKMESALKEISEGNIKIVVLAAEWGNYSQGFRYLSPVTKYVYTGSSLISETSNYFAFKESLSDTIKLLKANGKSVFIIEPTPEYDYYIPQLLAKAKLHGFQLSDIRLPVDKYYSRNREFFDALNSLEKKDIYRFDAKSYFCDARYCESYSSKGLSFYNDGNHLSELGLEKIQRHLITDILKLNH